MSRSEKGLNGAARKRKRNLAELHWFRGANRAGSLIYNQVFIEPNQSYTAGKGAIAAAGYVPGTQSYLKRKQTLWTQSQVGRAIANEGIEFGGSESIPLTNKQADSKYLSEQGHGAPTDAAWGTVMPPAMIQGDDIMSGFIPPS